MSDIYDASFQKDADIEQFVHELRKRLYEGRAQYGDKSFDRPSNKLHQERLEEALDGAGWSFVLWKKFLKQSRQQPPQPETISSTDGTIVDLNDGQKAVVKSPQTLVSEIVTAMTSRRMGKVDEDWAVSLKDAVDVVSSALMVEAPDVSEA